MASINRIQSRKSLNPSSPSRAAGMEDDRQAIEMQRIQAAEKMEEEELKHQDEVESKAIRGASNQAFFRSKTFYFLIITIISTIIVAALSFTVLKTTCKNLISVSNNSSECVNNFFKCYNGCHS